MSRFRLGVASLGLIALLAFVFGTSFLTSAPGNPGGQGLKPHVPGELLLKFGPSARALDKASARAELGAAKLRGFRSGAEHWKLGQGVTVETALERLRRNPHVKYAEPNYLLNAEVVPNDPRFNELYGMLNTGQTGGTADADIDADLAWNVSRGSRDVIVAVIDTGIDYNHPDLAANIWTNPGEIPGDNIDNDLNGYVDDLHGYDFVNNDGDPFDDNGHGTHCAGTIGASGNNNVGVAGVNWEVSLMAAKFLSGSGSGSTAGAILAVEYTTMMGASLTSNSWGGGGFSQALYDAIAEAGAMEIPFIAAAGNNGSNNDASPHYPSNYDLASVISVAATDHNDGIASFSNWGLTTVDIGAPGVSILSTQPGGGYQLLSGTSMATPHVAGVAALIKSLSPAIPVAQLKSQIMNFGDPVASLATNGPKPVVSGRRLNAFFPIADPDNNPPGGSSDLATTSPTSNTMGLTWSAPGDDGQTGTASFYEVRFSESPIDDQNFAAATRAGNEPAPVPAGGAQGMEVGGLTADTLYYFAVKAFDEWGNPGDLSNVATGTTLPPPTAGYSPGSFSDALFTGQQSNQTLTLRNDGVGTLDFSIPSPLLSQPLAIPADPIFLGKGIEPAPGDPVIAAAGGPDGFGYRWTDSNEPGGPTFAWTDISGTGTLIADVTSDDDTSAPINLGFSMPFYGSSFSQIRVCSNGWLSFSSSSTAYENQPLPSSAGPDNLVAPFWDDLDPGGVARVYYQTFGSRAIVQWNAMPRYQQTGSALTFQAILDASGTITYQYDTMNGTLTSATAGIQKSGSSGLGLTTAHNQAYVANGLAVRYDVLPQWLSLSPTSGRILAGGSANVNVHMDASGLDGGTYPGTINVNTNDPNQPVLAIPVTLVVTGAPDALVTPTLLAYGDSFLGLPANLSLSVANVGTDVLHVSMINSGDASVAVSPATFDVAPDGTQIVTVTWTPSALGPFATSLTVLSDDAGEPSINVAVTGNAIPAPVVVADPTSFEETLFSGGTSSYPLTVTNAGGSNLIVSAAADLGNGGTGIVSSVPGALGNGGPDAFGYRWRDSDAAGGPPFNFIDISSTGTTISFSSSDDALSAAIPMGMNFPLYGTSFSSLKVSTNGWLTFDTTTTSSAASNGTLPSTSLGRSAIAMYWDDLHLRTGNVKYLYDGTRFIVQYTGVGRFSPSTGHSFTFQAQLYPSGRVLVMYQTMSGATQNSATVGIQNQARTIALQVVSQTGSGTPYAHNNLALLFSRTPDWLTVTPAGPITVAPGNSQVFSVGFDATDRAGGTLMGGVVLTTNIPAQPTVTLPATLHVIGAPVVGVVPSSINYGTVFAGFPQLATFQIANNGTDTLNVSDVTTTDPSLTVEETPGPTAAFDLAPGEARLMNLRWSAPVGALSAQVRVHSSDPVTPIASIAVSGNSIVAPVAGASPSSFTESLNVGDVATRTVTLSNTGGSNLTFGSAFRALAGTPVTAYPELDLKKEEPDPRPGLLGSGGPDLFGYRWADSDQAGGPSFAWTDISSIGTPIAGLDADDENAGPVSIGFDFPYYGNTFSSVRVTTNGWLSFTSTGTDLSNSPLPNTGEPENLLAVFWDDLHFRGVERARYYNDGSRFIVQWTDVDRFSTSEQPSPAHLTFQAILYPNGRIVFQYLTMSGYMLSHTIGMQNAPRNDGLTVVHNAAYMHDGLAIEFRPPLDFLSVTPSTGTVPPGGSVDLELRIDASALIGGDYSAALDLTTNDPAAGLISIPVMLHVTGIPDIDVQPGSLLFPTTFVGFGSVLPIQVKNVGTDVLTLTGGGISGDFSTAAPGTYPVNLAVGATAVYNVTFTPTAAGLRTGSFSVASSDPDEGSVAVALEGAALIPPEVAVAPPAISTALPPGGLRTKTLTVGNNGGSDLTWSTGTNIISSVTPGTYVELDKDEIDTRAGILGSGGPDLFGYRWIDSDEPGGPVFDWVDISGVGTPISALTGDDQNAGPFPIGFPFSYYGNTFSTVRVTTNGWLSFTSTATSLTNQPLPNNATGVPDNLLAPYWDDLHFRGAVRAHYHNDGSRFIVQWTNVDRFSTSEQPSPAHLTFQAILYPSGKIVYQYLTMNGFLTSATIGMQNATKDDGLTVAFNMPYMHDNLAIELRPIPTWVVTSPTGGTIPAGGSQDVTVTLNAAGLDDGLHEATIDLSSNDPYTPLVSVPVSLNVGLLPTAYLNFDPDVLNLSSNGNTVKMIIELPAGYDPHAIDVASIRLNDTVPAEASPVSFSDENHNGVEEIVVRFNRQAVQAVLPVGAAVDVTVQLEVADVQWFRGTTTARTLNPQVTSPLGGEFFTEGQVVPVTWTPVGAANVRYRVHLSRDAGSTWEVLAIDLADPSFDWTVSGSITAQARIRVIATDSQGVLGYGTSGADFTIAGPGGGAPHGVGESLWTEMVGTDLVLKWTRPAFDATHGPAQFYRVMRSESAQGPFVQVGSVTVEEFREPLSATGSIVYYQVIAGNAAGDATE